MFNTFDNWESRYEMRTRARVLYENKTTKTKLLIYNLSLFSHPNRMESRSVNASFNFWGRIGDRDDIGARIYDKYDNKTLIKVDYYPPYLVSTRLRQGFIFFKKLKKRQ